MECPLCTRSHLPGLRNLQSPPLRHPLCAAAATGLGWMQHATCGAAGPRNTQVNAARSPTHVGGKATSSLIKAGRQADCGAQPAQLPGAHLAANSAEVPALSPGAHRRLESQAPPISAAQRLPMRCRGNPEKDGRRRQQPTLWTCCPPQDQTRALWEGLQLEWSRTLRDLPGIDPTPTP